MKFIIPMGHVRILIFNSNFDGLNYTTLQNQDETNCFYFTSLF